MASNVASYSTIAGLAGGTAVVKIGDTEITGYSAKGLAPAKANPADINYVAVLCFLVYWITKVYSPIAAMLVEMFPTRIRYTSMSLPHHIGNGWFGGLLPTIFFALVAQNGNIYYRL